jgi:lambda repressor-like predicted transcriptional regulator
MSLKGGDEEMQLHREKIMDLMRQKEISQNELARLMDVAHSSLSNALSGRRQVGRKILAGLLTVFPKETAASLTVRINQRRESI